MRRTAYALAILSTFAACSGETGGQDGGGSGTGGAGGVASGAGGQGGVSGSPGASGMAGPNGGSGLTAGTSGASGMAGASAAAGASGTASENGGAAGRSVAGASGASGDAGSPAEARAPGEGGTTGEGGAPAEPIGLSWPIDCVPDRTCLSIGYPDTDEDGDAHDCNPPGYFGHQGTGQPRRRSPRRCARVFATRYDHLKRNSVLVEPGDTVTRGQKLGEAASSGASTAPHLHFEVWSAGFYELADPWAGACEPNVGPSLWAHDPPWSG